MLLPRTTPAVRSAWLVLACLAVSACGGADTAASESALADQATSAPTVTGDVAEPPDTPEALGYVPWGPDDPVIPQWYADLAASRCTGESPGGAPSEFWDTAWAVCRAVFEDGPWPTASVSPPPPPAQNPHDECLDQELRQFVDRALAWRSAHPGATPQVGRADEPSPCFLRVYEVRLEDEDGGDDGTVVRAVLTVDGTYEVSSVWVDGVVTDELPPSGAGQSVQDVAVTLPRSEADRTVEVTLAFSSGGSVRGTATTQVEVPGRSESRPDPSGTPAPQPAP